MAIPCDSNSQNQLFIKPSVQYIYSIVYTITCRYNNIITVQRFNQIPGEYIKDCLWQASTLFSLFSLLSSCRGCITWCPDDDQYQRHDKTSWWKVMAKVLNNLAKKTSWRKYLAIVLNDMTRPLNRGIPPVFVFPAFLLVSGATNGTSVVWTPCRCCRSCS